MPPAGIMSVALWTRLWKTRPRRRGIERDQDGGRVILQFDAHVLEFRLGAEVGDQIQNKGVIVWRG